MAVENEIADEFVGLVIRILREGVDKNTLDIHYFNDVVQKYRDGAVTLETGYKDTKIARVLNNGVFEEGDDILVIKTEGDELWGYYPFFGPREEKVTGLAVLRDVYIAAFLDTSGSMNNELPAIRAMLELLREEIKSKVYGGDEGLITRFFLATVDEGDERFVEWMSRRPDEATDGYKIITLSFINESSGVYGQTTYPVQDGIMTAAFLEDVDKLSEETPKRRQQQHVVFNVDYPPGGDDWRFDLFLDAATPHIEEYGFSYENVEANQNTEFYLDLILEKLKEF